MRVYIHFSVLLQLFEFFFPKGSSFTPSSGLYATNNSVSNPANYTATQQVLYACVHTMSMPLSLKHLLSHVP